MWAMLLLGAHRGLDAGRRPCYSPAPNCINSVSLQSRRYTHTQTWNCKIIYSCADTLTVHTHRHLETAKRFTQHTHTPPPPPHAQYDSFATYRGECCRVSSHFQHGKRRKAHVSAVLSTTVDAMDVPVHSHHRLFLWAAKNCSVSP